MKEFYKSVLEQDKAPIVICDINHVILYMNPAAIARYEKSGGTKMIGSSILDCHGAKTQEVMKKILAWFQESPDNNWVFEGPGSRENKDVYMIALRNQNQEVIGYYEKHEYHDKQTKPQYWPFAQE